MDNLEKQIIVAENTSNADTLLQEICTELVPIIIKDRMKLQDQVSEAENLYGKGENIRGYEQCKWTKTVISLLEKADFAWFSFTKAIKERNYTEAVKNLTVVKKSLSDMDTVGIKTMNDLLFSFVNLIVKNNNLKANDRGNTDKRKGGGGTYYTSILLIYYY